jgi:hypothetical protein
MMNKKIIIAAISISIMLYYNGYKKGKTENYESERIAAGNAYEAEIVDLQNQMENNSVNYDKEIASLQKKQSLEINALQKKKSLEISDLQEKQTAEINGLREKNYFEVDRLTTVHEKEVIETRDSSYLKGQTDKRTSIQNQIDSKARENMARNDWDAPVYSVKK